MSTKDHDLELGTLVIVVLKARNLNDKYFWKQDVFAQVGLNGETKRTKVDIKGGQHPMWDEEIRIPVMKDSAEKSRKLQVSCWAKEPKKEENIGQGYVDLAETLRTGEFDDWVSLEINGTTRGEIYLEMTYYTNAPAPANHGLVVPKANLTRRPSKLSPADRLARPPFTSPSTSSTSNSHGGLPPVNGHPTNGLLNPSPPSSRTASASPSRGRESPLPPVPEQLSASTSPPVPSTLTPGRPRPQGAQGLPQHVPSVLRPRNPKSSPTPIPRPVAAPSAEYGGIPPPGRGYTSLGKPESSPHPYTPVVPPPQDPTYDDAPSPYAPISHHDLWGSSDSPNNSAPVDFSFPVPNLPGAREPTVDYNTAGYNPAPHPYPASATHERHGSGPPPFQPSQPPLFQPSQPPSFQPSQPPSFQPSQPPSFQPSQSPPTSFQPPVSSFQPPASFQPPTSFQAPGSSFPPPASSFQQPPQANRTNELPDPYLLARYQSPLPLPPGSSSLPRGRQPLTPPKSEATPESRNNPDRARIEALRQVEADAARRKTQEEKDLELARQLDRELNLAQDAGSPAADMPGRW